MQMTLFGTARRRFTVVTAVAAVVVLSGCQKGDDPAMGAPPRAEIIKELPRIRNAVTIDTAGTPEAEHWTFRVLQPFDSTRSFFQDTLPKLSGLARITQTLRTLYYDLTVKILREKRQVIPCYGGISNAHLNPYGDVWPCAILGYEKPMGNVREFDYDFPKLWKGERAQEVRRYIAAGKCACPLANQSYANLLLHAPSVARAGMAMIAPGK